MKKIGIITFHSAINYGVYLQSYALKTRIEQHGYYASIIDYKKRIEDSLSQNIITKCIKNEMTDLNVARIMRYLRMTKIKKSSLYVDRINSFYEFSSKYHQLTHYCDNYEDVASVGKTFDACVCGSDQIWNPLYTRCNPVYFLEFIPKNKRIAYAPSIGVNEIPSGLRNDFAEAVRGISYLSVREKNAEVVIRKLTGLTAKVVVDPTLLLGKNEWMQLVLRERKEKYPYILCYFLSYDSSHLIMLNRVKAFTGFNVIRIPMIYKDYINPSGKQDYASITKFLNLFCHADYILTDSFHGVIFSVLFNRNFYVIKRSDVGEKLHSRIDDFLDRLGLKHRVVDGKSVNTVSVEPVDYLKANAVLEQWRQESDRYLRESLSAATCIGDSHC